MDYWLSDIRIKVGGGIVAGSAYLAVAFLSWLPGGYRAHILDLLGNPTTPIPADKLDHALAYLLLGSLTALATRQTFDLKRISLAIVACAGILELGQLFVPDRDCCPIDFAVSAVGGIIGVVTTQLAIRSSLPSCVKHRLR